MKIEAGKYYRTRGGQVFGPMVRADSRYIWRLSHVMDEASWDQEGVWRRGWPGPFDLISEVYVSDTPPDAPLPDIITDQPIKTLRDEAANAALTGLLAKAVDDGSMGAEDWASDAYLFADAMMETRKK